MSGIDTDEADSVAEETGGRPNPFSGQSILYDLSVPVEWHWDEPFDDGSFIPHSLDDVPNVLNKFYLGIVGYSRQKVAKIWGGLGQSLVDYVHQYGSDWRVYFSPDGQRVTVLAQNFYEIRGKEDGFTCPIAEVKGYNDPWPRWRRAAWSPNSELLAVAFTNGMICVGDRNGKIWYNINFHQKGELGSATVDSAYTDCVASLLIIEPRSSKGNWLFEMIAVDYSGMLKCFYLGRPESKLKYLAHHSYSLASVQSTVTHLCYHPEFKILVSGGKNLTTKGESESSCNEAGLYLWRVITEEPFYVPVHHNSDKVNSALRASLVSRILGFAKDEETIVTGLAINSEKNTIACLDSRGCIRICDVRSAKILFKYDRETLATELLGLETCDKSSEASNQSTLSRNIKWDIVIAISWWDSQSLCIVFNCGIVAITKIELLKDLLGGKRETFEKGCCISHTSSGTFFILESLSSHCKLSSLLGVNLGNAEADNIGAEHFRHREANKADKSLPSFTSKVIKTFRSGFSLATAWIVGEDSKDVFKFDVTKKTSRLIIFCPTSPEELFRVKVQQRDYEEALLIASSYSLKTDLVYQCQWKEAPVLETTIDAFLSKVEDIEWVLSECSSAKAASPSEIRMLLKYGLKCTDSEEGCDHLGKYWDFKIKYRKKFLKYLDRLETYLHITDEEEDDFISERFFVFRDYDILRATVDLAKDHNFHALKIMFTYHGDLVLPYRLAILSLIPETVCCKEYEDLLPGCDSSGKVIPWATKEWRILDWSEQKGKDDSAVDENIFYFNGIKSLDSFPPAPSPKDLCSWYSARVSEIDEATGFLENALCLAYVGNIKNIPGLEKVVLDLETLNTAVYFNLCTNLMSYQNYKRLDEYQKFKILFQSSDACTFGRDVLQWGLGLMQKRGLSSDCLFRLMRELSVQSLDFVAAIFKLSSPKIALGNRIIKDETRLITLALECVYLYEGEDIAPISDIYECLPENAGLAESNSSKLHERLDTLETQISAVEIFGKYGVQLSIRFFLKKLNTEECMDLFIKAARLAVKESFSEKQWRLLLGDFVEIQKTVFDFVPFINVLTLFVENLMCCGKEEMFGFAKELMNVCPEENRNSKIPYLIAVQIVVKVSREYFNSASSSSDSSIALARGCLSIIEPTDEIESERGLILATELLSDFGCSILPIQVRLNTQKKELVLMALSSRESNFKRLKDILHLCTLLKISEREKSDILCSVAEVAFDEGDFLFAYTVCLDAVTLKCENIWNICFKLGCEPRFHNTSAQGRLLGFALAFCPVGEISIILESAKTLDVLSTLAEFCESSDLGMSHGKLEQLYQDARIASYKDTILDYVLNTADTSESQVRLVKHPFHEESAHLRCESGSDERWERMAYFGNNHPQLKMSLRNLAFCAFLKASQFCLFQNVSEGKYDSSETCALSDLMYFQHFAKIDSCTAVSILLHTLKDTVAARETLYKPSALEVRMYQYVIEGELYKMLVKPRESHDFVYDFCPSKLSETVVSCLDRKSTDDCYHISEADMCQFKLLLDVHGSLDTTLSDLNFSTQLKEEVGFVDLEMFVESERYRKTIFAKLLKSPDDAGIKIAVSLTEQYSIGQEELGLCLAENLLRCESSTVDEYKSILCSAKAKIGLLLRKELSSSGELYTQYNRLHSIFKIACSIEDSALSKELLGIPIADTLSILGILSDSELFIDIKALVSSCEDSMCYWAQFRTFLKPFLTIDNASAISSLCKFLHPKHSDHYPDENAVFTQVVLNQYQNFVRKLEFLDNGQKEAFLIDQGAVVVGVVNKFWRKCYPLCILRISQALLGCPFDLNDKDTFCVPPVVTHCTKFKLETMSALKSIDFELIDSESKLGGSGVSIMEKTFKLVKALYESIPELNLNPELVRQLQNSLLTKRVVEDVCVEALSRAHSLTVVKDLLSFSLEDVDSVTSICIRAFEKCLSLLQINESDSSVDFATKALNSIANGIWGNTLADLADVGAILKEKAELFSDDVEISLSARLVVRELLGAYFGEQSKVDTIGNFVEIEDLVYRTWKRKVAPSELQGTENRVRFILELLNQSTSQDAIFHIVSLIQMLDRDENNGVTCFHPCWFIIFYKLTLEYGQVEWVIAHISREDNRIFLLELDEVTKFCELVSHQECLNPSYLKLMLLFNTDSCCDLLRETLRECPSKGFNITTADHELCTLIIKNKAYFITRYCPKLLKAFSINAVECIKTFSDQKREWYANNCKAFDCDVAFLVAFLILEQQETTACQLLFQYLGIPRNMQSLSFGMKTASLVVKAVSDQILPALQLSGNTDKADFTCSRCPLLSRHSKLLFVNANQKEAEYSLPCVSFTTDLKQPLCLFTWTDGAYLLSLFSSSLPSTGS
eukprot:Nk52_evm1s2226 gene=Nk52_evmTU1s2226